MLVSQLKNNIADKLREAFQAQYGLHLNIFAGDFRTADGYWRQADVYRWQIYGELFTPEHVRKVEISSWASLTMCRSGVLYVTQDNGGLPGFDWEADHVKNDAERKRLIAKHEAAARGHYNG